MKIPVEVSARHVHLSLDAAEKLFGENYEFKIKRELSQKGQYLYEEKVDLFCGENFIKNVSILGPMRKETQLEISLSDARKLKMAVPIKESGNLENSPGFKLVGPKGEFEAKRGLIAAKRHLHIPNNMEHDLNVKDSQIIKIKIEGSDRNLVFDDVVVRSNPNFSLALHIDTDEGNAANCIKGTFGEILLEKLS